MKHRRYAGILLSLTLLFVGAPSAMAHELPTPSPVPSVAPLSELEQYKLAMEHFRSDSTVFKKIANKFTTAVTKAQSVFDSAMRTAKSDRARTIITAQRDSFVEIAINNRDAAIEEMGGAPVMPTEPVKPVVTAIAKKTKTSKPSPTPSP